MACTSSKVTGFLIKIGWIQIKPLSINSYSINAKPFSPVQHPYPLFSPALKPILGNIDFVKLSARQVGCLLR